MRLLPKGMIPVKSAIHKNRIKKLWHLVKSEPGSQSFFLLDYSIFPILESPFPEAAFLRLKAPAPGFPALVRP